MLLGEIVPQSRYTNSILSPTKNTNIFKVHFEKHSKELKPEVENYLMELLDQDIASWFVTHYMQEVTNCSENLLEKLIDTGLKVKNLPHLNCFAESPNRINKTSTSSYLNERFPTSNQIEKDAIIRMFYWVQLDAQSKEYEARIAMLLTEYANSTSDYMKQQISSALPNSIAAFPEALKDEARACLGTILKEK